MSGYERNDVSPRPVALAGLGLLALMVLGLVASAGVFAFLTAADREVRTTTHPMAGEREVPTAPLLQVAPTRELLQLREWERDWLHSYGWIDPTGGVVRIPVERAMALTVEEGLPARREKK